MKKSLIISIVLSVSIFTLYSQNKTIKGGVIDESLETWPCVSIMINDTVKVGETNVDGFFQVEIQGAEGSKFVLTPVRYPCIMIL